MWIRRGFRNSCLVLKKHTTIMKENSIVDKNESERKVKAEASEKQIPDININTTITYNYIWKTNTWHININTTITYITIFEIAGCSEKQLPDILLAKKLFQQSYQIYFPFSGKGDGSYHFHFKEQFAVDYVMLP